MATSESEAPSPSQKVSKEVEVSDSGLLLSLTGPNGAHLRTLERAFGIGIGLRGNVIRLQGEAESVTMAERTLLELIGVLQRGSQIGEREVQRSIETLRRHPEVKLTEMLDDVVHVAANRKSIQPKGVTQQRYIRAIRDHDVVFGVGPAGTGKTYLAMAMAVSAMLSRKYKRIILTRPAVEAGERLGFLPGDLAEKVNPYLRPLYDALHDMMDMERAQELLQRGTIEVAPLAFMRGRTLNDSFVILDEAQNTTVDQMKMFLTRLGYDSKAVITGDVTQVDLPNERRSGLSDALTLLTPVEGIAVVRFADSDVVRHPLVQRIIRAYDKRDAQRAGEAETDDAAALEVDEPDTSEDDQRPSAARDADESGTYRAQDDDTEPEEAFEEDDELDAQAPEDDTQPEPEDEET